MRDAVVTVFGASGFIGRHVVLRLARRGARVRAVTRDPDRAGHLRPLGEVGQIALIPLEGDDRAAIEKAFGVGEVTHSVNLVGILHERRSGDFDAVHRDFAGEVAAVASAMGVRSHVHLSAIGADANSKSAYARSKAGGEAAVRRAAPGAAILRPSVVFGPGDGFFVRFAEMAAMSPFLPLVDGGRTRFQPVYVGDVADAVVTCLEQRRGDLFELGGPKIYTFEELLRYLLRVLNRRRALLKLSSGMLRLPARVMEILPEPPLTRDQLKLLEQDNVVAAEARTLLDLGIAPTPLEAVVPSYVRGYARPRLAMPVA
ncbi:MAG: complex I NDUFA9 subunit family protein [Geminicoccaceae bacterium]|nr:complex I NDUFA9 subunit family protein [Geminicoccaceae bacterium]